MNNNQNNYNDPYNTNTNQHTYYQVPNPDCFENHKPARRNVATLVLSIVSLVCGITCLQLTLYYGIGLIFGIAGLITRSIALKKNNGVGGNMAMAGFITSLIGTILSSLIILIIIIALIVGILSADNFNGINFDFNTEYYY